MKLIRPASRPVRGLSRRDFLWAGMVAINGEKLAEREWRDTVVVPRNGSVTFRSRFLDFTGRFVHHCHMMNHEELGMMQVVEVYAS
jgi:FtsP/CotA-like multicopper oxidase with cupredoxin domain